MRVRAGQLCKMEGNQGDRYWCLDADKRVKLTVKGVGVDDRVLS